MIYVTFRKVNRRVFALEVFKIAKKSQNILRVYRSQVLSSNHNFVKHKHPTATYGTDQPIRTNATTTSHSRRIYQEKQSNIQVQFSQLTCASSFHHQTQRTAWYIPFQNSSDCIELNIVQYHIRNTSYRHRSDVPLQERNSMFSRLTEDMLTI